MNSAEKKWKLKKIHIEDSDEMDPWANVDRFFFNEFNQFYYSTYACPYSGKNLYKTVFKVGHEFSINTDDKYHSHIGLKRVFTCKETRKFFAAALDRLSDGTIYEYTCDTDKEFIDLLNMMNASATSNGRPDGGFVKY